MFQSSKMLKKSIFCSGINNLIHSVVLHALQRRGVCTAHYWCLVCFKSPYTFNVCCFLWLSVPFYHGPITFSLDFVCFWPAHLINYDFKLLLSFIHSQNNSIHNFYLKSNKHDTWLSSFMGLRAGRKVTLRQFSYLQKMFICMFFIEWWSSTQNLMQIPLWVQKF